MTTPKRLRWPLLGMALAACAAFAFTWGPGPVDAKGYKPKWKKPKRAFRRIATFPVFLNEDISTHTVAEIVAATEDDKTLMYTDSENETAGFVDISNAPNPKADGSVDLPGEPTSVGVLGKYALVCVNGFVIEKVEGMTRLRNGIVLIVTDNDGVDDSSGETQLINLGRIFNWKRRGWLPNA